MTQASDARARLRTHATARHKNKRPREVGRREGRPERAAEEDRESEGRIGAMTSGNGWHPDPAEQRRPVSDTSFRRET